MKNQKKGDWRLVLVGIFIIIGGIGVAVWFFKYFPSSLILILILIPFLFIGGGGSSGGMDSTLFDFFLHNDYFD